MKKETVPQLWFDVGIKRYTTLKIMQDGLVRLWFDVGIKRYTTMQQIAYEQNGCGLM